LKNSVKNRKNISVDEEKVMKEDKTVVMIDNTTYASAGRAIYSGRKDTEGGRHAEDYYRRYPDAVSLDRQSLAEFLTALVLFDTLVWDASSTIQESKDAEDSVGSWTWNPWIYQWFPQFDLARKEGIISHVDEYWAFRRLNRARLLSLLWVKEHYSKYKATLPMGFRIPLAYKSEDYRDLSRFDELNSEGNFNLNKEELAVAMFLHRGMFYQSRVCSQDGWSYLPHSYRAHLLRIPEIIGMTVMCDGDTYFELRDVITGVEILRSIDEHFQQELNKAIKLKPIPVGTALGASFMQMHDEAYSAFTEALSFRYSKYGENIRKQFRELVALGSVSNRQGIENRILNIDRSLRNEARSYFGAAWTPDPNSTYVLNFIGSWKALIEPIINYLPMPFQEGATKFLNKQFNRNGFQILFSRYL
jgi:hypothetical protein